MGEKGISQEVVSLKKESLTERQQRNLAILETLRRQGPISRMDISRIIDINPVTVSHYMERFKSLNLVYEKAYDVSQGGRRPLLMELNGDAGLAIGIGINLFNVVGILTDLSGKVLYKYKLAREDRQLTSTVLIEVIQEVISEIMNNNSMRLDKLRGVGIGVGGVVDHKTSMVYWPERTPEDGYQYTTVSLPLVDIIANKYKLPVFIENDATLACFAEHWFSLSAEVKNVLYMFSGVGAGIMIDGKIYRGATGAAGEVALLNNKSKLYCSEFPVCLLQRWEADLGILDEVRTRIQQDDTKGSVLLDMCEADVSRLQLEDVFQAASIGDPLTQGVIEKAAEFLGIRIAYLMNILNPDVVIIGGGVEEAGAFFFSKLRKTIEAWAFEENVKELKLIPSTLGEDAVALGSSSLVVRHVFLTA